MPRLTRQLAVAIALALIAVATLQPGTVPESPTPKLCLVCGSLGMVDVILNVALFIPFGVALAAAGVSWRRAILACLATSVLVEGLQFSVIVGRDATISDVLTNTLGGAIGAWSCAHWRALVLAPRRQAQRLALGFAAAALVVMAATAWLLQPALPRMLLLGQWTPQQQAQFEPYSGHVATFHVNGIPAAYGLMQRPDSVRAAFRRFEAVAHLEFLSGRTPTRLSAIARVVGEGRELFLLGATGDAFVFRASLRTRDLRLRTPSVAIAGALGPSGESVTADVQVKRDGWHVRVARPGHLVDRLVPFSLALGWSFVLPFEHPLHPSDAWWSALWLAALALPAALWGALAAGAGNGRVGAWWLVPAIVVASGLAGLPRLAHFAPATPIEWGGLLLGLALGVVLAPWLRRRALDSTLHREGIP